MAKLNDNQKILAIAGGGLALCLLAGGGVWWAKGLAAEVSEQITSAKQKIDDAEGKIAQIRDLEDQVIILRENVDTYTKILPEQDEVTDFIRMSNKFIYQSGVAHRRVLKGASGSTGKGKYARYSYRLEVEGTLWQFMKLINLYENYDRFVRVVSYTITGAQDKDVDKALAQGRDVRHKFSLVVETYVYAGKNAGENIVIPNYAAKRDNLREEVAQGQHALQLLRYDYVEAVGRRDIFIDPRPRVGGPNPNDNPKSLQRKRIDEFIAHIAGLRELHALWEREDQTYVEKAQRETKLREQLDHVEKLAVAVTDTITHQSLQLEWNNDVLQPIREIRHDLGDVNIVENADEMNAEAIEDLYAEMRADVERGDFDAAIKRHETKAERMRFDETDPRFAAAERLMRLKIAIERVIEFSDIPMSIDGVVVFEEGRSGLLVNGTVYEEGEYLDENLLLKTVRAEEAEFVFKGFSMLKKW